MDGSFDGIPPSLSGLRLRHDVVYCHWAKWGMCVCERNLEILELIKAWNNMWVCNQDDDAYCGKFAHLTASDWKHQQIKPPCKARYGVKFYEGVTAVLIYVRARALNSELKREDDCRDTTWDMSRSQRGSSVSSAHGWFTAAHTHLCCLSL